MSSAFLEMIVAQKREEVAAKKSRRPARELTDVSSHLPVRDFYRAVSPRGSIIAELKARTPSIASFAQSNRLEELASIYEAEGAAAVSIVTDEKNFGTSLDLVAKVKDRVALPVLVKEFVIDPYQVLEARAAGADALLLIVRLLDAPRLAALLDLTWQLGMIALVEAHTEAEMHIAVDSGARIIGINNRNLDDMSTSLDTTRTLAGIAPRDVVLVSESGIDTRADIEDLSGHGVCAFLIGGSLLSSEDPAAKLREFTGPAEHAPQHGGRDE